MLSEAKHLDVPGPGEMGKRNFVFLTTNESGTLYTGVTGDLHRRVQDHKAKLVSGFTRKYNISRLVCYEEFDDVRQAIRREKQIKGWRRTRKIALIETVNPDWRDMASDQTGSRDFSHCSE